jgi:phosphoadenosine phosphosulfate reductase
VPVVEWDETFGLVKLNPLATWTEKDIWTYIHDHGVPYNALHDDGYPSIGCMPCTRRVKPGEDMRAGRWSGFDKTECGLHVSLAKAAP